MAPKRKGERSRVDDRSELLALLADSRGSGERAVRREGPWEGERVFVGRYEIEELIGQGGMGRVFRAFDRRDEKHVAIKIVSFDRDDREQLEGRFRREIEIMKQLSGAAFVPIFDHSIMEERAYFTMELLEGESLHSRLANEHRLDAPSTLELLGAVALGLQEAHAIGFVHRDLKPSNIYLDRHGDVRLLDFGIARALLGGSTLTKSGSLLGSPHYVSPEQARGEPVDQRADLWSLAVILYRCLTGRRPFEGELTTLMLRILTEPHLPASRHVPTLPAAVDAFFERALAKSPDARFQSAAAMVAAFREALGAHAVLSPAARRHAMGREERPSERTLAGGASYEAYAACVTQERTSYPTLEAPPAIRAELTSPRSDSPRAARRLRALLVLVIVLVAACSALLGALLARW